MAEAFNPHHRWLGIPLDEQPPNHYRLLGIGLYESDPDVIESAADRQMAHVRTFQVGRYSDHSQSLLNELADAKNCLLKPPQKAVYDQELRAKLAATNPPPPPSVPAAVPVAAIPVLPAKDSVPLTSQANVAPQQPEHFVPQIAPGPRSPSSAPISRPSRKSKGSNTTLLVGIGVLILLIVGIVGWQLSQRNRRYQQDLAAKPDSTRTPNTRATDPTTRPPSVAPKQPTKKTVVPPAEVKSSPVQPSAPQPIPQPVTPQPAAPAPTTTSPVAPAATVASVPSKVPNVPTTPAPPLPPSLNPSPNPVVPREIKLCKPGAFTPFFTADSAWLIYANGDHIDIWNLAEEKKTGTIAAGLPQFDVSPDGKKLAAAILPASLPVPALVIKIFDLATLQELHRLSRPAGDTANMPQFSVCGFDGVTSKLFTRTDVDLQVWDVNSGEMLRRIKTERPPGNNRSISSLNGRYLTVDTPPYVNVLDTETEKVVRVEAKSQDLELILGRPVKKSGLSSWSFSADGQTLYGTETVHGMLLQWSLPEVKFISGVELPDLAQIKVSPDGTRILAESKDARNISHLLDRASLQVLATMPMPGNRIVFKAISPNNRWVILSTMDESRLYDFGPQTKAQN